MPVTHEFHLVPTDSIKVEDNRHRAVDDLTALKASIKSIGLLNPIIITRDHTLVAGAHRLQAYQELELPEISIHYLNELDSIELKLVELEENIKRSDLSWEEYARAVLLLHELKENVEDEWTTQDTADMIGLSRGHISMNIQVARALLRDDKRVKSAMGLRPAFNIISREQDRAIETELGQLGDIPIDIIMPPLEGSEPAADAVPAKSKTKTVRAAKLDITQESFLTWAPNYTGRRFNIIHCDFPYGIGMDKSHQGKSAKWGGYEDSPELYWELCNCLISNRAKILFPSTHILFWFSMKYYQETLDLFQKAHFRVQPFPLIWHKTDNKGIIPDVTRGPRRVYETAFLMSMGDRKVIKCPSNLYGAPTNKTRHQSEKPIPMLKHFFEMIVDDLSEVFDPTCGSANALVAAEALGAKRVVGMDIDPDVVENAQANLTTFRNAQVLSDGN